MVIELTNWDDPPSVGLHAFSASQLVGCTRGNMKVEQSSAEIPPKKKVEIIIPKCSKWILYSLAKWLIIDSDSQAVNAYLTVRGELLKGAAMWE